MRNTRSETRNPKSETQNPTPENRHPKPEILNTKHEIRNTKTHDPKPETRNSKPETRNPPPSNTAFKHGVKHGRVPQVLYRAAIHKFSLATAAVITYPLNLSNSQPPTIDPALVAPHMVCSQTITLRGEVALLAGQGRYHVTPNTPHPLSSEEGKA
jgi:hypothetical protein